MKAFIGFLVCSLIATSIYYLTGLDEEDKGDKKSIMETISDATISAKNQQPDVFKEFSKGLPPSTTAELLKEREALIKKAKVAQKKAVLQEKEQVKSKSDVAYKNELRHIRQQYKVSTIVTGGHSLAIINGAKKYVGDLLSGGEKVIKMNRKMVTVKRGDSEYTLMK